MASHRSSIPFWHPLVTVAYKRNQSAPSWHPDVQRNFTGEWGAAQRVRVPQHAHAAGLLPVNHPNITALILNPGAKPLPFDHVPIEPWIGNITRPSYTPYR